MKIAFKKSGLTTLIALFLFSLNLSAQKESILHSVYFFGNLADVDNTTDFVQSLKSTFSSSSTPFTLIVNGDLVNEKIKQPGKPEQLKKIFDLADMMEQFPNGKLILLPGDRDWNDGQKGGEKES